MNHRKHKQEENQKIKRNKEVYTPEGYINDPPGAKCPYCGEENKVCSYIDSMARAWGRQACAYKHKNVKLGDNQ
jgi:hypothetical protein